MSVIVDKLTTQGNSCVLMAFYTVRCLDGWSNEKMQDTVFGSK